MKLDIRFVSSSLSLQFLKFIDVKFLLFCIFNIEFDKKEIISKLYSDIFISVNSFVSNVKSMYKMFYECYYFNQDIRKWDVSNVENTANMFAYCEHFNQDISSWDVSNVKTMNSMFYGCMKFRQNLDKWDVQEGTNTVNMFDFCNSIEKLPNWYKLA